MTRQLVLVSFQSFRRAPDERGHRYARQAGAVVECTRSDLGNGIALVGGGDDDVAGGVWTVYHIGRAAGNCVIDLCRCRNRQQACEHEKVSQDCCFDYFAVVRFHTGQCEIGGQNLSVKSCRARSSSGQTNPRFVRMSRVWRKMRRLSSFSVHGLVEAPSFSSALASFQINQ